MRGRWSRGRGRTLGAVAAALLAGGAAWWTSGGEEIGGGEQAPASVEVPLDRGALVRPAVGASIVVTIRWGRTDTASPTTAPDADAAPAVWDGFVSLDCGQITQVTPLSFELDDPDNPDPRPFEDFLGHVVRGDNGDTRVYWRSKTRLGWDGVRVKLIACDATRAHPELGGSTLAVRTEQRDYTARLDWSANDFISLPTDRPGQHLEIHINAEYDERALAGARITALTAPAPEIF